MPARYAALVRRLALSYINRYGDDAVEVIRAECIRAHRSGSRAAFAAWRDVGVVADDLLLARDQVRRPSFT